MEKDNGRKSTSAGLRESVATSPAQPDDAFVEAPPGSEATMSSLCLGLLALRLPKFAEPASTARSRRRLAGSPHFQEASTLRSSCWLVQLSTDSRSPALALTALLALLCGCSAEYEGQKNSSDDEIENDNDSFLEAGPLESCRDPEFEGADLDVGRRAGERVFWHTHDSDVPSKPLCVQEDGLGGEDSYCRHVHGEEMEIDDTYYFYCDGPVWEHPDTGEVIESDTPCIWSVLPHFDDEDQCVYPVVCVPEDRLDELGWPADASFEYHHDEYGFDICDDDVWTE